MECICMKINDRYLFKAIDTNSVWRTGLLIALKGNRCAIEESDGSKWACDAKTLCQCTGLKDKNGKLIWENDIVGLYNENKEKRYAAGSVEYGTFNCSCCDGVYGWYFTDSADIRDSGRYEVIGNIFDNPELLESEG